MDVFFYGLFMDPEVIRAKGLNPENIRKASAPGLALRIGQRATLTKAPDSRTHGMLMALTPDEIDLLYSEKSVSTYRSEAITVELTDGSQVSALCFNLPRVPGPDEANPEYALKLRDLARRLGLPSDYVSNFR